MISNKSEIIIFLSSTEKIPLGDIVRKLKEGMTVDVQKTFVVEEGCLMAPTSAGLPLSLNITALAHVHIKEGLVKLDVKPSLYSSVRRNQAPAAIKAELEMKPK